MTRFTHFDEQGASRMVDVGEKPTTRRTARASASVRMQPTTLEAIVHGTIGKGGVCEVARLAGIMAAKRTSDLIPLCHPLGLESVSIRLFPLSCNLLRIESTVEITAKTGVEMEALTAVSVAALTVYDMCKSVDRAMVIEQIQLEEKAGGASGAFSRTSHESLP
jgi:cyclic pyranopterin monophosphate synthase